ncbi:MAG: RtsE [Actinobacteria bacterium]|nr:RtsE [Actinomycetota bacterium]|tara:strand:- start:295 stop:843 length:549 start_codon:yes stop_codon:yes gene_type:complete
MSNKLTKFSQYQRVGVFVDVQNMFYSAKRISNAKLDFNRLMEKAVRGRQLIRAICYVVENPEIDQTGFVEMLKQNGYEIKSKALRMRADGSSKADWDMGMAIDAVSLAQKLDIIVIVSGDGDFVDLVYHLKSLGVSVEAISFLPSTNEDLIKAVDLHVPVEDDLLLKPRKRTWIPKKSSKSS